MRRHFLQVAENRENNCLCFQLCFAELKDYKGRSKWVCYIRVFWKNPGQSLLWTTTVVHDNKILKPTIISYMYAYKRAGNSLVK